MPRYAIYFTPAHGSPWWQFGAHWLGRDEKAGGALVQPAVAGFEGVELSRITEYPRRYGFHATLKAPFALADGVTREDLAARMSALACTLAPVALGPMHAVRMGDFVAIVPLAVPHDLAHVEAACVTQLDGMRAPLSAHDLARRLSAQLDARAQALLQQYGYPHVLDRYRLHFTLTGPVNAAMATQVVAAVASKVERLNASAPLVLDRLCLFEESGPGQPLVRLMDAELSA